MDLDEIRREIDRIDEQMKALFLQRMDCSRKVAETKKRTGTAVYAKEREQEILGVRSAGVEEEYLAECRAFFACVMEISRIYQYSRLTDASEKLRKLPEKEGKTVIDFLCCRDGSQISVFLTGAALAGLNAEMVLAEEQDEGVHGKIRLSGDFSSRLAKAAVLLILQESEKAVIL